MTKVNHKNVFEEIERNIHSLNSVNKSYNKQNKQKERLSYNGIIKLSFDTITSYTENNLNQKEITLIQTKKMLDGYKQIKERFEKKELGFFGKLFFHSRKKRQIERAENLIKKFEAKIESGKNESLKEKEIFIEKLNTIGELFSDSIDEIDPTAAQKLRKKEIEELNNITDRLDQPHFKFTEEEAFSSENTFSVTHEYFKGIYEGIDTVCRLFPTNKKAQEAKDKITNAFWQFYAKGLKEYSHNGFNPELLSSIDEHFGVK